MSWLRDIVKSLYSLRPRKNYMTARPTELDLWTRGTADVTKMPSIPFLGYRFVNEIYMYSDLLKTIIRSLVQETFRKGITIEPRFVVKCVICGTEYDTKVETCEVCGSHKLRPPNPFEKKWMEDFMHDVNYNDQSLVEVLQDVDTDLNIYDNAYLAVVKRYDFNSEGRVVGAEVVEVIRANPENVLLIMDKEGRPGRTDDGRVVMICLEHRDKYVAVPPEHVKDTRCQTCGKWMYPAYFAVRKSIGEGGFLYYTDGEILHIKKFTHGVGYGLSPIFAVWMKVLTLIKQDFFILTAYHLERSPRGVLILRGQFDAIQKAWHKLQTEAQTNPHIIYPLIVEGADKVNRIAEWIDLSFSAKDIDFIQYREEVRRTVGALWGVMPLFHGDTGGGAGLANEGLQIVVTNRAVEREQTLFNEKVLSWLSRQLGVSDWEYQLVPNEGRDVVARIQRETMRIANAERMAQLGYRPIAIKTDDGIDFYYEYAGKPIAEEKTSGYIASKVYQEVPEREIPRYEGEPEHGRPRVEEQRFEGEELARRPKTPTTFVVGEGGKLIPEEEVGKSFFLKTTEAEVPVEYRRYIKREDIPKLPPGTRVHRGPRGGLFVDVREVPEAEHFGEKETPSVGSRGEGYSGEYEVAGNKVSFRLSEDGGEVEISSEDGVNVSFSVDKSGRIVGIRKISGMKSEAFDRIVSRTVKTPWDKRVVRQLLSEKGGGIDLLLHPSSRGLKRRLKSRGFVPTARYLFGKDKAEKIRRIRGEDYLSTTFEHIGENVFLEQGAAISRKQREYIERFWETFRLDFGGKINIIKEDTMRVFSARAAGLCDDDDTIYIIDRRVDFALIHEYLHHIYNVYERAKVMRDSIESFLSQFLRRLRFDPESLKVMMRRVKEKDETKLFENVLRNVERMRREEFLNLLERYVTEAVRSGAFTDEEDEYVKRSLYNLLSNYRKIMEEVGGHEAIEIFEELDTLLKETGGGITRYSREAGLVGTEGLASAGDLFYYIMFFQRSVLREERSIAEQIIANYGENPIEWLRPEVVRLLATKVERFNIDVDDETLGKVTELMRRFFKAIRLVKRA